jgi:hypothetical protein
VLVDRHVISQTLVPGLSDVEGSLSLQFQVDVVGMSEPQLCQSACTSSKSSITGVFTCTSNMPSLVRANTCRIAFTPTFTADIVIPVVEQSFTIDMILPSVRAHAVNWTVNSQFYRDRRFGVSGTVLPSVPNYETFYGTTPTTIGILLRPAVLERLGLLEGETLPNLFGYLSYLVFIRTIPLLHLHCLFVGLVG